MDRNRLKRSDKNTISLNDKQASLYEPLNIPSGHDNPHLDFGRLIRANCTTPGLILVPLIPPAQLPNACQPAATENGFGHSASATLRYGPVRYDTVQHHSAHFRTGCHAAARLHTAR